MWWSKTKLRLAKQRRCLRTLDRLMHEGLDRHEAIHAIASILMSIVSDVTREADDGGDINAKYRRELANLTAAGWRSQAE
jgi:hypothetical protein